jgi:hypothetical protein
MTGGEEASRRGEFRAWVRARHPDVGGEPGEFAAGLALWRERLAHETDEGEAGGAIGAGAVRERAMGTGGMGTGGMEAGATPDWAMRDGAVPDVTVFRTYGGLWMPRRWWQRRRQRPRVR